MLEPGTIINNRYRVVKLIGEGGMGAVYEVIDENLGTTRALKQTRLGGEEYQRAFKQEARLLSRLRHPALPLVTDYFIDTTGTFLVMEFISGQDLATLLDKRREAFPIADVLRWADELLDALNYLHSQNPQIIHRDIKPQNLKLTTTGDIILLDFGLAKSASIANIYTTAQVSVVGYTPQYAPIEQIQQQGTTTRSDLYSLAATLYCLLTGEPPARAGERAAAIVSNQPDPLRPPHEIHREVPRDLSRLIMQAMALDPAKRPASATAFRTALQPIQVRVQQQKTAPLPTQRQRPRWLFPVIGILAVLLLGFVAAGFTNGLFYALLPGGANSDPTSVGPTVVTEATTTPEAVVVNSPPTAIPNATNVPTASATATPDPTAIAAVAATETAAAIAADRATIAAELPERAARHLSGEFGTANSQYNPGMESGLLANGYSANIITIGNSRGLQPSQNEPTQHTWVRDLDYALSGYGYVIGNMSVLRENTELFLADVVSNGIVPDVYNATSGYGLNRAWDSMPNLIHAMYVYVAKTGDYAFYRDNRQKCLWIGEWIAALDTNDNGLPDQDVYPYGYYNSIQNSVLHTYALAKFYAAYTELAELERAIGEDGTLWEQRATRLREAFHRPYDQGGYWRNDLAWPVGWRDASQQPVRTLETFGVFEALRSGLISPADAGYTDLMLALHNRLPDLMPGQVPLRLALDGYPPELLRDVVQNQPWKLDVSAPWIVGLAAPAYAEANYPEDAVTLLQAYTQVAEGNSMLVPLHIAVEDGIPPEGPGSSWGSAGWFMAVYGGHYGLTMTPAALIVEPHPFTSIPDDGVQNLSYQGATIQLQLDPANQTYRIQASRLTSVVLRPMGNATQIQVNGEPFGAEAALVLQPGIEYLVTSQP